MPGEVKDPTRMDTFLQPIYSDCSPAWSCKVLIISFEWKKMNISYSVFINSNHLYYNSSKICLSQLANCRLPFLLDRLGRCIKLFVWSESTTCHMFASQFGLAIFYMRKTHKTSGNRVAIACVYYLYFNEAATPIVASGTGGHGWAPPIHRTALTWKARQCVCARACVHDVFSIYDNNIWPRLIMIILSYISYKSDTLMISPQRVPG